MTRCASSWSNSCPEVVAVTIQNTTNNYTLNGDQIAWRQESFVPGDLSALVGAAQAVVHSVTGETMKALYKVQLDREPQSAQTMQIYIQGSTGQRPLITYSADHAAGTGYDFFVDGDYLYLNFELAAGETLFVQYVGITLPGDPTLTTVGSMNVVASTTTPTAGWLLADGTTPYSSVAYSRLYDWLAANGNGILIDAGESTESFVGAASFVVPAGSFVIRYLRPDTFAALIQPSVGQTRDASNRVEVKA